MSRKRRGEAWGRFAELLAALLLRLEGYRVLLRRFRTPVGEIDLIARRGRTLVFVEVKARRELADAYEAITPRQQKRTARAAELFLLRYPDHAACNVRFDVVAVRPWRLPRHLKDAWRPA